MEDSANRPQQRPETALNKRLSRRDLLRAGLGATAAMGAGSLLAACGGGQPAPAAPTAGAKPAAPAVKPGEPTVLRITGWGGTWEEVVKKSVIPDFEKEYNCKIEYDTAFPFVPKLLASPKNKPVYDLLHANSNEQWQAAEAGYVEEKIDPKNVPNIKDVYPYAVSDKIIGVSLATSAIGLGYRTDKISQPPTSWKDLWEKQYANVRATYVLTNTLGDVLLMMAGQLYGSGMKDIEASFKAMEQLRPIKLIDFTGTMEKALLSGEVSIAVIHDSAIWRHLEEKAPLSFVAPKEGVVALEQVYSIVKGSDKKELAYALTDKMLSPEVQQLLAEKMWYSPSNKNVNLGEEYSKRLFASEEKVKQLLQVDWKWFNANQDQFSVRYNKIFQEQ